MTRNKIIRAVTASLSLCFFREVMIKMRGEGYEMVAISSPGKELEELRDKDGFTTIAVPMARHISLLSDVKSLFKMIRIFIKEKPRMVHSMTPKAGLICTMAGWLTRVPVRIHTFTGLVWPTASGLKRKLLMFTDRITCACATHIIPEGQGVMNDLQAHITKKPMKVLGYGNVKGINVDVYDPSRICRNQNTVDTFNYLFVGRIVGDKGINELIEAFTDLSSKYYNITLTLVGEYEPELDPVCDFTLARIKANPRIFTPGHLLGDILIQEYANADCYVFPSYREGFPNTVIEAGAMGLPCIVTDINGSREIVEDGKNGMIIPSHDEKSLYSAMEKMYRDDEFRTHLAENARPMIVSRFEEKFVQGCLIKFYEEILGKNDENQATV